MNSAIPKISIITPSYNQGQYIEQNIKSVLNQNYPNVEHIVIDGGSSDCTVEILKKFPHLIWVSEKDDGQADALNKGLKLATGDLVGWINSDDYYQENIFESVASNFSDGPVDWVIGNITYRLESKGIEIPDVSRPVSYRSLLRNPDIVRQQSTFFRRSTLEEVGAWNSAFHMVMDLDLWLRMAKISSPRMIHSNWSFFRVHEAQKTVVKNLIPQMREIEYLFQRENYTSPTRYMVYIKKYLTILRSSLKSIIVGTRTGK